MRGITKKQKEAIFERAGGCCEYCLSLASFSSQPFSIEHIHPQHLGGGSDLDNLALSCQGCNIAWGSILPPNNNSSPIPPALRQDVW